MFQKEEGFDFLKTALRNRDVSLSPDSVIVHPPDVCCWLDISIENQQKVRNMCKLLINCVCSVILEQLKKKKSVSLGASCQLGR